MTRPERGEVWWCEPPDIGRRPVVVLSRSAAIIGRGRALVAPCTTTVRGLPSEVTLDPRTDPVPRRCGHPSGCSSSGSADCPTPGCARCARRSRWPSTANGTRRHTQRPVTPGGGSRALRVCRARVRESARGSGQLEEVAFGAVWVESAAPGAPCLPPPMPPGPPAFSVIVARSALTSNITFAPALVPSTS